MKRNQAGITLIEVLIAVTLLSILSTGVLIAMRLALSTLDKTDQRLIANRRVANSRKILENELDGFIHSTALFNPEPNRFQPVEFLQAEAQSMRFETAYSLEDAWRGRPQIAALQVIPGGDGKGVRLILNQSVYMGPVDAGRTIAGLGRDETGVPIALFTSIVPTPRSFVLADRLAYCRFSYLEVRTGQNGQPLQLWRPNWVAANRLPLGVRVEMAPLDPVAADLHVSTVTVPLNVNLTPGIRYVDQFEVEEQ